MLKNVEIFQENRTFLCVALYLDGAVRYGVHHIDYGLVSVVCEQCACGVPDGEGDAEVYVQDYVCEG
jgi:hypothetical protein